MTPGGAPLARERRSRRLLIVPEVSRSAALRQWIPNVAVAAALVGVGALSVRAVSDPSPWLHLKVGQFLLDGHRFGLPDPWAPLATRTYVPTEWLPSVLGAVTYDHLGLPAVAWFRSVGIVVLLLELLLVARARTTTPTALVVAAAGMLAAWPSLTERPQLLGFVLLVPVMGAWLRTADDGRPRWWLIPLTWLSACVHGIWSIGVGVGLLVCLGMVLDGAAREVVGRRLPLLLVGSVAAAGFTPLGPRLLMTPFTVGQTARQFVGEWQPASARTPAVALTLLMLGVTYLLWLTTRRRPPWAVLLPFLVAIALTLTMQRTVAVGALLAVPLLAEAVEGALCARRGLPVVRKRLPRRVGRQWLAATLAGCAVAVPVAAARSEVPVGVPEAMKPALVALPERTRVVADGDLTGWMMFAAPNLKPVYDIRAEVYGPSQIRRFIAAMAAEPGWDGYIRETGVRVALLESDSALGAGLVEQLHWRQVAKSGRYVLLERP